MQIWKIIFLIKKHFPLHIVHKAPETKAVNCDKKRSVFKAFTPAHPFKWYKSNKDHIKIKDSLKALEAFGVIYTLDWIMVIASSNNNVLLGDFKQ